ncbi:response regulator transcription factor [Paraferrimonas haliotis]|uniref:Phosphate regulon transcriptional regulatory protein PhoB n=1 Tax=Paraferrimonas haliotis TaxID=2013866 RepID=A0AA37TPH6_9GAMM|nr:response regulator transcription factor [Paraferrimonas haliotis]GLS84493.1 DNA-binding response regulator [Paraferrimonas haliotis]
MNLTSISSQQKLLLISNEPELTQVLNVNLTSLGYDICHCASIKHANKALSHSQYSLILLDRRLPDGDGILLAQQLRQNNQFTPIMVMSDQGSEADIVLGLESGADDYLVKPVSVLELRARIKARLRQSQAQQDYTRELCFEGVRISALERQLYLQDKAIKLTAREFDLLWHLACSPQQVFSREQLLQSVWGYHHHGYEHTVNSHVNRLRNKLANYPGFNELVQTVWGVGYKFAPKPQSQRQASA